MNLNIPSGKYVVAVSGGVDSVVLLDMLAKMEGLDLVVAHFDHGIRDNSGRDAEFVAQLAAKYDIPLEVGSASLGSGASEDLARETRYNYLQVVRAKHSADAIVTAHHQDDLLETAIINLARGTGRRGLSSLKSSAFATRPLLSYNKQQLKDYAAANQLQWVEDETNDDPKYLRNHIRANVLSKFNDAQKDQFLSRCQDLLALNNQIDAMLAEYVGHKSHKAGRVVYPRSWFNSLPHEFAMEVVHHWFNQAGVKDYDIKRIEHAVLNLKALKPGKTLHVGADSRILLTKRSIRLQL